MVPTIEAFVAVLAGATGMGPSDVVLDVACGPGVLTCAVASRVRRVTGIDVVPTMLEQARRHQRERGLSNMDWRLGDATSLEVPTASFSLVITRYAFHHLLEPVVTLTEMARVCQPGGRVAVADATPSVATAGAFNEFERRRDPSHVRALPIEELEALGDGLPLVRTAVVRCDQDIALETVLTTFSFPLEGDLPRLREMVRADVGQDRLGLGAYVTGGEVRIRFPTSLVVWSKPL
jgi:SAM-dependent methyltransferase